MGYQTLNQFRDELNHSLGEQRQGNNELLDLWINRGYFEVANMVCHHFLKVCVSTLTTADAGQYTLPLDLMAILSVKDETNKRRLLGTSISRYHTFDISVTGNPSYYVRRGPSLYLWPTPSGVFTIELIYVEQPAALIAGGDTTVIPNVFDQAIVFFSERNALLNLGMDDKATLRYQAGVNYVNNQMTELELGMSAVKEGIQVATSFDDLTRMQTEIPSP